MENPANAVPDKSGTAAPDASCCYAGGIPVSGSGALFFSSGICSGYDQRSSFLRYPGTPGERLLTAFLAEHFPEEIPESGKNAEWHNRLYYRAGILKDDLSNDVLTYGIHASTENGPHPGIEGFLQMKEPMRLTLNTVSRLVKVCPQNPDETLVRWFTREHIFIKDQPVFVFENPAVFSALICQYPQITAICGNGQPRLTTLALMDRMAASGCRFYYAGDYDPEGLVILQNLRHRYRDQLIPWKYSVEYYKKYQSDVIIPEASLKKLDRITIRNSYRWQRQFAMTKKPLIRKICEKNCWGKTKKRRKYDCYGMCG